MHGLLASKATAVAEELAAKPVVPEHMPIVKTAPTNEGWGRKPAASRSPLRARLRVLLRIAHEAEEGRKVAPEDAGLEH